MFGFIKNLFSGDKDTEYVAERMVERHQKWIVVGAEIAQDCFQNGLSKGAIVNLSEIEDFIKQNYAHSESVVKNGFLSQMKYYMDQNIISTINKEDGDIVFIHKDFVNDVLNMK